jgi:NADP-reducing hydrogenase subunit HndD
VKYVIFSSFIKMLLLAKHKPPLSKTPSRRYFVCHASNHLQVIQEKNKTKVLVVQVAPAVRVGVGEAFGKLPNEVSPKQLVTALRKLGFHYVFDTLFSADVTILEEGTELLGRLKNNELNEKPMFTSCCPGWIGLAEQKFPEILPFISTTKSPQMIMGAIVKHIFSFEIGLAPEDIYMVSCMPCLKKQGEADRECERGESRDVDLVITTNELVKVLKEKGIDVSKELESDFDHPLGEGTGGAAIFGKSGGVMTAALRYAYYILTGMTLETVEFTDMKDFKDVKEAEIVITPSYSNPIGFTQDPITIKVAIVCGIGTAKKYLQGLTEGKISHHFVEIMACAPYGCVGGSGQIPVGKNKELLDKRKEALTAFDDNASKKAAYENEEVKQLYEKHLGKPGEHNAHDLFHTHYESHKD